MWSYNFLRGTEQGKRWSKNRWSEAIPLVDQKPSTSFSGQLHNCVFNFYTKWFVDKHFTLFIDKVIILHYLLMDFYEYLRTLRPTSIRCIKRTACLTHCFSMGICSELFFNSSLWFGWQCAGRFSALSMSLISTRNIHWYLRAQPLSGLTAPLSSTTGGGPALSRRAPWSNTQWLRMCSLTTRQLISSAATTSHRWSILSLLFHPAPKSCRILIMSTSGATPAATTGDDVHRAIGIGTSPVGSGSIPSADSGFHTGGYHGSSSSKLLRDHSRWVGTGVMPSLPTLFCYRRHNVREGQYIYTRDLLALEKASLAGQPSQAFCPWRNGPLSGSTPGCPVRSLYETADCGRVL